MKPKELVKKIRELIEDSYIGGKMHTHAEFGEEIPLKPLPTCRPGHEPDGFILHHEDDGWVEIVIR